MSELKITHSEILRDKIFEHLPSQARNTLMGVKVTYWPNCEGEMVLELEFDALDSLLDIEAREGVYGPDDKLAGHYVRGCELDANTGEIHAYTEEMETTGSPIPLDEASTAAERDTLKFDEIKLNFFLNLFESL